MTRVVVLVTGQAELLGLEASLQRLFPRVEFDVMGRLRAVRSAASGDEPFNGVTTADVLRVADATSKPTSTVREIVASASAIAMEQRPSLVVVLDDLELANAHQPDAVVAHVRQAAIAHTAWYAAARPARVNELRSALADRVSIHLAVPMIESWIFADPHGPARAGVGAHRLPPLLQPGVDPEQFQTADDAYHGDDGAHCVGVQQSLAAGVSARNAFVPWTSAARQLHPKNYLYWLCRSSGDAKRCSTFKETGGGANALRGLDWSAMLARDAVCQYLRALVHDVADAAGEDLPAFAVGQVAAPVQLRLRERSRVLRNA